MPHIRQTRRCLCFCSGTARGGGGGRSKMRTRAKVGWAWKVDTRVVSSTFYRGSRDSLFSHAFACSFSLAAPLIGYPMGAPLF